MLPVTFSGPGDAHERSIEDAMQLGAWLMLRADNVNREHYSPAGLCIVMDREEVDDKQRVVLPQQIVKIGFSNSTWRYNVTGGGIRQIQLVVIHLEKRTTEVVDEHTASIRGVPPSALALVTRTEQILLRGTLWRPGQLTNDSKIVDPYRSPTYTEDDAPDPALVGAYKEVGMKTLNGRAPEFRRGIGEWFLPRPGTMADLDKLDLSNDLAVAYFVFATYEVKVPDRDDMTTGGHENE